MKMYCQIECTFYVSDMTYALPLNAIIHVLFVTLIIDITVILIFSTPVTKVECTSEVSLWKDSQYLDLLVVEKKMIVPILKNLY